MIRSLYSGISGMRNFQVKLDVIGNNIANVNTVGFKAGRVMFSDILSQTVGGVTAPNLADNKGGVNPKQIGLGAGLASIDTIHTTGSPMTTTIASDLSINGNGFFAVQNGTGEIFLTRAGNFTRDAAGQLVTQQGFVVLDVDGTPITIQHDTPYTVGLDGVINQKDPATGVDIVTKPQIGLVVVSNPGGLEKVGNTFFRMTVNADDESVTNLLDGTRSVPNTNTAGSIVSGQLEMSNVDLTTEFSEMIVAQRGFQANSRIITTSDSILEEVVNLKR